MLLRRSSPKKNLKHFALKPILFAVVFFAALECGLNILTIFLDKPQSTFETKTKDRTIVCMGDSHTQGMCAPEDQSYPAILNTKLGTLNPDNHYTVINLGKGASNTSQILRTFSCWLKDTKQKPGIAILQGGINNQWNSLFFSDFEQNLQSRIEHIGSHFKSVKLIRLCVLHYQAKQRLDTTENTKTGQLEKFNNAIACNNFDAAMDEILKLIENAQSKAPGEIPRYILLLRDLVLENPAIPPGTRPKLMMKIENKSSSSTVIKELFEHIKNTNKVKEWVEYDYARILDICNRNGITLVIANDPNPTVFDYLRQSFAKKHNLAFCSLAQLHQQREKKPRLYISDQDHYHNTPQGYQLMADLIYNTMADHGLFEKEKYNGLKNSCEK